MPNFEAMIPQLRTYYTKVVHNRLGEFADDIKSCDVKFVEQMKTVNGVMFHMQVAFGNLFGDELKDVVNLLDQFCVTEEDDGPVIDGYKFLLGDGDDSMAVWFDEDGKFHIWLRGWK